jgi:hypothetical protein
MLNKPITLKQLKKELVEVLKEHNMTVAQFQAMDVDDINNFNLRDLKLIVSDLDLSGN